MAKKSTQPAQSTKPADPKASFAAAVVPALLGMATARDASHTAAVGTRETLRLSILELRQALPEFVAYHAAVEDLLGNGVKGKENKPGSIIGEIPEAQRLSLRVTLSAARRIANWIADPKRFEEAKAQKFEALDKASKPAPSGLGRPADPAKPGTPTVTTLAQLIETFGVGKVIAECSRVLAERGDAENKTRAASLAAIAVHAS